MQKKMVIEVLICSPIKNKAVSDIPNTPGSASSGRDTSWTPAIQQTEPANISMRRFPTHIQQPVRNAQRANIWTGTANLHFKKCTSSAFNTEM